MDGIRSISLIVSVYNEQDGLGFFYESTKREMEKLVGNRGFYRYGIYFVDDGSTDRRGEILDSLKKSDPEHVKVITLSRNFGHEAAMTAGLDYAEGDYLIFMDSDLQHPPECVSAIMDSFEAGHNIVSMIRTQNDGSGALGGFASSLFYSVINRISEVKIIPAASDFFALDRQAAEVLKVNYREKVRFLRGFVQNIGFDRTTLEYKAPPRVAGRSHYSFKKLLGLSVDALSCFSDLPLRLGIYAGLMSGLFGVVMIIYTLFTREGAPSGYATIIIVLCFMFSVLFLLLGIIGSYISVMFREMKDRPIYIVGNIK